MIKPNRMNYKRGNLDFLFETRALNQIDDFEIKKLREVGIEPTTFCVLSRCDNHYTTLAAYYSYSKLSHDY